MISELKAKHHNFFDNGIYLIILMNQQKKIVYSQKPQRKIFIDYSPKMRAKNQESTLPRRGLK